MAITATSYQLLKSLPVHRGSTLLEIGEANVHPSVPQESIGVPASDSFEAAREFYESWFAPDKRVAIDYHGTPSALRLDLNQPNDLGEQFDVVINNGTAEHIFNIAQVFKTMHDHCHKDGWLIHDAPFTGWTDHGFFNLNPTVFYDLAFANNYELVRVAIHHIGSREIFIIENRDAIAGLDGRGEIPPNSMLFVAYRKRFESEFRLPMQGYYDGRLSEAGRLAWEGR